MSLRSRPNAKDLVDNMVDMVIAQPIFIGMIIAIVVLVLGLAVAAYKIVCYMADMNAHAPEAFVIKEAREKKLPILALHDAGSGKTILKLGKKSKKFDWEFEVGEYGPKVSPEHTPDCEPDMLGGNLPIYHYDMKSLSACSPRSADAVCNITKLRAMDEFALLRFLPEDDLYTLLAEDAANLEHDCRIYLQEYAVSNIGQPIPNCVDDFVALIQDAREVYANEDWQDEDAGYIYTSLEAVEEKPLQTVAKAVRKSKHSLRNLFKTDDEPTEDEEPEEIRVQPQYQLAYRTPYKLEPFSFKYAFRTIGNASDAITVRALLDLAFSRGFNEAKKNESRWVNIGICALLILMGGAFAIVIVWKMVGA